MSGLATLRRMDRAMSGLDKVLLWFVKVDDRLRDNQAIKFGV